MPEKTNFIDKILSRLDRMDKASVQTYIRDLALDARTCREVLDQMPVAVILISKDTRVRYLNRRAELWLETPPSLADHPAKFFDVIKDESLAKFLQKYLKGLETRITADIRLMEPRQIDIRAEIIALGQGASGLFLLLLSEQRTDASFRSAKQIPANYEALIRLAAGVAHEIGNPLNAINIHLSLLEKKVNGMTGPAKKPMLQTLSVLRSETSRLDRIVKSFLKAARKPPLRFKIESLTDTLTAALNFMEPELAQHHITTEARLDGKLPNFFFDRERIHEACINLLKNAMEAMPKGGCVHVTVSQRANLAILRIRDEGTGIPAEDLPHIFNAYYTTKPEGSGLGLWIVYQAVAEHGGRIDVETREGKGTTFTVLLPVSREKLRLPNYSTDNAPAGSQKGN